MSGDDVKVSESVSDFGSCCRELRNALSGEDFESFFGVGSDGVLYMSVGQIELDDDEDGAVEGMVDHPVFFCPFCGEELQTSEVVLENSGEDAGEDKAE